MLDELTANGVKFTPENVIATTRSSSVKVVFLETGNLKAGLQHIIEEHGSQFAQMGVSVREKEKGTDLFFTHLLGCDFLRKEIAYAQSGACRFTKLSISRRTAWP